MQRIQIELFLSLALVHLSGARDGPKLQYLDSICCGFVVPVNGCRQDEIHNKMYNRISSLQLLHQVESTTAGADLRG